MIQLTLLTRTKTGYRLVGRTATARDSDFVMDWSTHDPTVRNRWTINFPEHRGKRTTVTHVAVGPPNGMAMVTPLTVPLDVRRGMIASFSVGALTMTFHPNEERILTPAVTR